MIRKYEAWICDINCGAEAIAERNRPPMGWRKIPVEIPAVDRAHAPTQEERHICPFCVEALMQIEADAIRRTPHAH